MKSLWHFFRLIRPLNLLVIVLTMGVFQVFLSKYQKHEKPGGYFDYSVFDPEGFLKEPSIWDSSIFQTNFLLLVFSTVLIAAAGNIINDYFDVKADRVNKPDLLVIDKYIKRRWAIILHWSFNVVGILIAFYLSWKLSNWWIVLLSFVCINLLWFYSAFFKRKFLLGNLIVALLVATVPIYVLVFFFPLDQIEIQVHDTYYVFSPGHLVLLTVSISATSFFLNLIREIIKDMADVKGDLLLNATTLPIKMGMKKTKWILFSLLFPLLIALFLYVLFSWEMEFYLNGYSIGFLNIDWSNQHVIYAFIGFSSVAVLASYIIMALSNQRRFYLLSSNLLKLAMFFGLLTPLFL
ncbi:MAG: geranylgeranylglycerol-phosphate geranylgeranyltransferase [Bacteroidetes bacterium]|nr:geranylgeranylglycerol-phosphate geranylgeranyltransferase [Bacteroidota bacterium]